MDSVEKRKKEEVLEYLEGEEAAVLSLHAADGTIDAATVFFLADQDLNFYFTTKIGTRKFQNIANNPQVSLTISNAETLRTVEVKGVAHTLTDSREIVQCMVALNKKSKHEGTPWVPPIALLDAGQYLVIKVVPTWLRYGVFLNEEPKGEYFKQII